ncbi:MAG: NmrA family NAD(P)-binding protein [Isosphaeraceae bacterium]|nr:NmrA family NAD(P)-binding protein [Isosphaeraceae bacterium]
MTKPTILVTGATGKTGNAVAAQLLAEGWPVRAVVRRHDERSERLARRGAEIAVADLFDPEQLLDALRGTQRAYYVPPMHPHMLHSAVAFADAAREAGVEHVVQMSQWTSSPNHPSIMTRQTWLVDRLYATIPGVAHTIVNPGMFADNFLRTLDMAAHLGLFPVLTGTSKSAPVSNEDIARVVVAIVTNPDGHEGRSYRPTGPKLLSGREMAAVVGSVLGKSVRPMPTPVWMLSKVARSQGVDPFSVSMLRHYLRDHERGAFEVNGGVTDVVEELTGRAAESFETTVRRYAGMPFAERTIGKKIRGVLNFLQLPFQRGYDLNRFDREHSFPTPTHPKLTMDSTTWLREHVQLSQAEAATS